VRLETIMDLRLNSAALCAAATISERQGFRVITQKPTSVPHDRSPAQIDDRCQVCEKGRSAPPI
jgi:hypothetical protein